LAFRRFSGNCLGGDWGDCLQKIFQKLSGKKSLGEGRSMDFLSAESVFDHRNKTSL
jgi:hypothetical protein